MRKEKAFTLIQTAHKNDPNKEIVDGIKVPKELAYSDRMLKWLLKFNPEATELQQLAATCQHLYRWEIERQSYPMGKKGYHQWRISLYDYQANKAAEIMESCEYTSEEIEEVKGMVAKKELKNNSNTQLIEDIACLVFIEHYLEDFSVDYSDEKLIKIIQRTWNKMSDKAHEFAVKIEVSAKVRAVLQEALA
jgi:hypothetical protein